MDLTSAVCRDAGFSAEQLASLADFESSDLFSETERLVLRYSDGVTATPVQVSDELFASLAVAFTPKQLVELTTSIAWENFRARFDHALGMESEGFFEGAACQVGTQAVESNAT